MDVQATVLDRPSSPTPSLLQDLHYDPAMGAEVGGTVPESDSSSTTSLAADGGSVAGSAAGFGVHVQGVQEVPQVWARAVAVGMASLDGVDLHEIFRRRAIVMPAAFRLHLRNALPPGRTGTRHGKSERGSCSCRFRACCFTDLPVVDSVPESDWKNVFEVLKQWSGSRWCSRTSQVLSRPRF